MGLAAPVVVILAAQLALKAVWCWLAYRLLGRSLAREAGAFFGFMFGTMANSFAPSRNTDGGSALRVRPSW